MKVQEIAFKSIQGEVVRVKEEDNDVFEIHINPGSDSFFIVRETGTVNVFSGKDFEAVVDVDLERFKKEPDEWDDILG